MKNTRGAGYGWKFERLDPFSVYIKLEGTDKWIDERNLYDPIYSNLNDYRHQTYIHEMEKKRRGASQDDIPSKKKITVSEVMSEQQMFQEEHLKLQQRVNDLEKQLKKTVWILRELQQRFDAHVSADSAGVIAAANSISSLGTDELVIWDGDFDCNCPDNLACPVHPKK